MKSLTIGLDDRLVGLIQEKASLQGLSLNKTIVKLLEESLNIHTQPVNHEKDLLEFFGVWSKEEADEFDKAVEDFEKIDPEEWK